MNQNESVHMLCFCYLANVVTYSMSGMLRVEICMKCMLVRHLLLKIDSYNFVPLTGYTKN